jgi:hypothetical protein
MSRNNFLLLKVIFATFFVIFLFFLFRAGFKHYSFVNNSSVNGTIDSIKYTKQGWPVVMLDGNFIDLTNYSNPYTEVKKGDSLVKRKGERTIMLFRHENNKAVCYEFW